MKNFSGRIVDLALSLLLASLLLSFASSIIRPLMPLIIVSAAVFLVARFLVRRRRAL